MRHWKPVGLVTGAVTRAGVTGNPDLVMPVTRPVPAVFTRRGITLTDAYVACARAPRSKATTTRRR